MVATSRKVPTWPFPESHERKWAIAAQTHYEAVISDVERDFLCVSPPSAGKTRFALRVAALELQRGVIDKVVVVVPTDYLREQWVARAESLGVDLALGDRNPFEVSSSYFGTVVTYQQIAGRIYRDLYRQWCARYKVLVIFDEIHHMGREKSWGEGALFTFGRAHRRLFLSGTPWRTDGREIPFLRRNPSDDKLIADYTYPYWQAIGQNVCRSISFPMYDGRVGYRLESKGAVQTQLSDPDVSEDELNKALAIALAANTDYMSSVLADAVRELASIREEYLPGAGGLVICMDQDHARGVARQLKRILGHDVPVAISDEPDAANVIRAFEKSKEPWLVSVRMVSEGVDIPRLCVGVFATNWGTELYFRQTVGRFIRVADGWDRGNLPPSRLFIPSVAKLQKFALEIEQECEIALNQAVKEALDREREKRSADPSGYEPDWLIVDEVTALPAGFIDRGFLGTQDILNDARALKQELSVRGISDTDLARILAADRATRHRNVPESATEATPQTDSAPARRGVKTEQDEFCRLIREAVGRFVAPFHIEDQKERSILYARVHKALTDLTDGRSLRESPIENLPRRLGIIMDWKEHIKIVGPQPIEYWRERAR